MRQMTLNGILTATENRTRPYSTLRAFCVNTKDDGQEKTKLAAQFLAHFETLRDKITATGEQYHDEVIGHPIPSRPKSETK